MPHKLKHRSKLIRSIKYALVIATLITALVLIYFVITNQNSKVNHKTSNLVNEDTNGSEPNIAFKAKLPDFTGISLDHGPYYIQANEMEESAGYVSFIEPKVKLMLKHLDWLNLTAKRANLTISDNHLQLFDDLHSNLNKQYYFNGEQAEILAKESIIQSSQYSKFFSNEYNLESQNGFILNYNDHTVFFHGSINLNIKKIKDQSTTNIKSDQLDVFWKNKIGHFLGHVILTKDGTIVQADKMTAIMNPKTNQLDKIHTYGHVKITNKDQIATGEYGEYIVATSILTLRHKVELLKQGNVITGEVLHYNFNTQKADLVGAPQKNNQRVKAVIIPKS